MRVCFITQASSYHSQRWARALAAAGHDIHLVSPTAAYLECAEVHVSEIYSRNWLRQILNIVRVRSLIRMIHPDVIHLFGLFSVNSFGSMWAIGRWSNLVISVSGSDIINYDGTKSAFDTFIIRHLLRRGRTICAASNYLAGHVHTYGADAEILTIPWGAELGIFSPAPSSPSPPSAITIGFAKQLRYIYGCDILLKAFGLVRAMNPDIEMRLRIAGDGPEAASLKQVAVRLGIDNGVEWLGWISSDERLSDFYRSLDIFVMPSRNESFGLAAVEAGACGIPSIAARVGGVPEIIDDGVTGLLFEKENTEALASAMARLASDAGLRRRMGEAARRRVAEHFDWNKTLRAIEQVYAHALVKNKNIFR